jgi:response regulator RpfG family c-di-GMP phosphodiesterase
MNNEIRILVIDDEPEVIAGFSEVFTNEGYQVLAARNWNEASRCLRLQKCNIIFADARLPDIMCREMIEAVKKLDQYAFIITTAGFSDIETAIDSLQYGAYDYLSKPFDPADVTVIVRKVVEKQRLESDNVQLFETIKVLALALDARDHYTHGHSQEVTEYAVSIAQEMGLSVKEIDRIRDAGILHDIGKIGIPDAVLLKPGRLTEEEYDCIKRHPQIGKDILEPVRCLSDKIPLIYHHHERYDGKGYPVGLSGEAIPLGARILAVADAYQAMTSDRPYRKALSIQVAIIELENNKGKQFDEKMVDIFVRILKRLGIEKPAA